MVYRETRNSADEAVFDAGFAAALGAVHRRGNITKLTARPSPCGRYIAVHADAYPTALFIYNASSLRFCAALLLAHPVLGISWEPGTDSPIVYCTALDSGNVYAWQAEGAQCLPHPERGFRVEQVEWRRDGGCCVLRGRQDWCVAVRSH